MEIRKIDRTISVSPQIAPADIAAIKKAGFRSIICNRPDGEGADQPGFGEIEAKAQKAGLEALYMPIQSGMVRDEDAEKFGAALQDLPGPVFAYCRTGTRSATLWSLSQANAKPLSDILAATKAAGYDMNGVARRIANGGKTPTNVGDARYDVVIVGGGAAGISVAASIKSRKPDLDVAIIDPADVHYYQPGWTMVGGGIFDASVTAKTMGSLIPRGVHWLKSAVAAFEPKDNAVILDGCRVVSYGQLVVCPGLKLDWAKVEGLEETLGENGVTSNYRYDLAPYTWQLVQQMKEGRAIFTQPPMPIKCAGAPQKAMYLSADHWLIARTLIDALAPGRSYHWSVVLVAAFVMVMWDLSMDPSRATINLTWIWHDGGAYFGVPFVNFAGWFLCVATIFAAFAIWLARSAAKDVVSPDRMAQAQALGLYAGLFAEFVAFTVFGPKTGTVTDAVGQVWNLRDIYESLGLVSIFTMGFVIVLTALKLVAAGRDEAAR